MQDVAGRIVDQFAGNLATLIAASAAAEAGGAEELAAGGAAAHAAPPPTVHADESIDLLGTAGAPVLKRAIPIVIGVAIVVGVIVLIARRRRR